MAHEREVWLFADCVGTLSLVDGRPILLPKMTWPPNPLHEPLDRRGFDSCFGN